MERYLVLVSDGRPIGKVRITAETSSYFLTQSPYFILTFTEPVVLRAWEWAWNYLNKAQLPSVSYDEYKLGLKYVHSIIPRISVRRIEEKDTNRVQEINIASFVVPTDIWPIEMIHYYARNKGGFVATLENGTIVGFLIMGHTLSDVYRGETGLTIMLLGVDPAWRRKGVGERLIKEAINQSVEDIFLQVRTRNINAYNLYTRMGFQIVALLPRYYTRFSSIPDDAYYMRYRR